MKKVILLFLSLFLSSSPFHLNLFPPPTLSFSLATEIERAKKDPTYYLRVINPEAKAALEGLYQEYKAPVSLRLRNPSFPDSLFC